MNPSILTISWQSGLPRTENWSICWQATKDDWNVSIFHSKCDGKNPTLTIIQVVKNSKTYVFGGYANESWDDPKFGELEISISNHHFFFLPSPVSSPTLIHKNKIYERLMRQLKKSSGFNWCNLSIQYLAY